MKRIMYWMYISLCLTGCSEKKPVGKYPVIDMVIDIGNYQKVYCSDYFTSMELIPLETRKECLLGGYPKIALNDSLIFISGWGLNNLYVFYRSGKFRNQIGNRGRGPGEYLLLSKFFINREQPIIYIEDYHQILEYSFDGKFIRSFLTPKVDGLKLEHCSYVGDNVLVGEVDYNNGKSQHKYCLFNPNGDVLKCFPSHFFLDKNNSAMNTEYGALNPIRIDNRLYLKDYINDTLYVLNNQNLQPAFVFKLGKYNYPNEYLSFVEVRNKPLRNYITIDEIIGTPNYFFYRFYIPVNMPKPENGGSIQMTGGGIRGIYNIAKNTNIFLDTYPPHHQIGIINDYNGGLSFFPQYYAGNGKVVDVWQAEDMKEILTEEYFSTIKIKDRQAHQKLREILKKLKEEDNPVVVIAKLK